MLGKPVLWPKISLDHWRPGLVTNPSSPVVIDDPPTSHWWTADVASAAFTAAASAGLPVPQVYPQLFPQVYPWPTGGNILCRIQNILKIVTRTCNDFVYSPAFASAISALIFCLFCLSYIYSAAFAVCVQAVLKYCFAADICWKFLIVS